MLLSRLQSGTNNTLENLPVGYNSTINTPERKPKKNQSILEKSYTTFDMIEGHELPDEQTTIIMPETLNNSCILKNNIIVPETLNNSCILKNDSVLLTHPTNWPDFGNIIEEKNNEDKKDNPQKIYKKYTQFVSELEDQETDQPKIKTDPQNRLTICNVPELTIKITTILQNKSPINISSIDSNQSNNKNSLNIIENVFSLKVDRKLDAELKGDFVNDLINESSSDSFGKSPKNNIKFNELDITDN